MHTLVYKKVPQRILLLYAEDSSHTISHPRRNFLLKFSLKIPLVSFLSDCRRFIVRPFQHNCNPTQLRIYPALSRDHRILSSYTFSSIFWSNPRFIRPNRDFASTIYLPRFISISKGYFSTIFTKSITSPGFEK